MTLEVMVTGLEGGKVMMGCDLVTRRCRDDLGCRTVTWLAVKRAGDGWWRESGGTGLYLIEASARVGRDVLFSRLLNCLGYPENLHITNGKAVVEPKEG